MKALLYCFPIIFYCNLLEEVEDLNKLLATLSKQVVENDYYIVIPWREKWI
jgi:hypothetical protein